jgi:hypothetical protein
LIGSITGVCEYQEKEDTMLSISLQPQLDLNATARPTSPTIASSLLTSREPETIEQVTQAMEKLAIATEVCVDIVSARQVLNTRKFDVVTVDFDLGHRAAGLLEEMRISPSNRTAPAISIIRNQNQVTLAHSCGTNFVLQHPLTDQSLHRTLAAGYGLIVRERRRYFRSPVKTRVMIRRADMRETRCYSANISEGGMEIISAPEKLVPGVKVHAEFSLPGSNARFCTLCETRWRNLRNHAGIRFLVMPLEQRCDLQEWLRDQLEKSLPDSVAGMFRDADERFRFKN